MPRVSVIIPTYNRTHLIRRAVDSVLAQTAGDLELIVVDDCSKDDTAAVVAAYTDPRVRLIRHEVNGGGSAARNTGIAAAGGEFVAFLDSDDEWLPEKLERQLAVFGGASESVGLVFCRARSPFQLDQWTLEAKQMARDARHAILVRNIVGSASLPLMRRSCLEQAGGFDPRFPSCQDWELWVRMAQHCEFEFLPEFLVLYHPTDESITRNRKATLAGHHLFEEKYRDWIAELPRAERGQHLLNMARVYWWNGERRGALARLVRSAVDNPRLAGEIGHFLLLRPWRKLLRQAG